MLSIPICGKYMGSIRVVSKYIESIHMYRLCIGYVSVILYAGREETGANGRISNACIPKKAAPICTFM